MLSKTHAKHLLAQLCPLAWLVPALELQLASSISVTVQCTVHPWLHEHPDKQDWTHHLQLFKAALGSLAFHMWLVRLVQGNGQRAEPDVIPWCSLTWQSPS